MMCGERGVHVHIREGNFAELAHWLDALAPSLKLLL